MTTPNPAGAEDTLAHAQRLANAGDLRQAFNSLAQQAATTTAPHDKVSILVRASEYALALDGPDAATDCIAQARDAATSATNSVGIDLAEARIELRRHTGQGLDRSEELLAGLEQRELAPHEDATRLKLRGLARARRGQSRAALADFDRAYTLAEGAPAQRARILLAMATQLRNWGIFDEAGRKAERSLELRLQLGDRYGAAMCYGVLAFIHQRSGNAELERDALTADLRVCQAIGAQADISSLRGRLAGALFTLGKYAGAWNEAKAALELEYQGGADDNAPTRVMAFAWRDQARVLVAQSRWDEAIEYAARSRAAFESNQDPYGAALAILVTVEAAASRLDVLFTNIDADAQQAVLSSIAQATATFARLGALPELVSAVLLKAQLTASDEDTAQLISDRILPMLQQSGFSDTPLFHEARMRLGRLAPALEHDRAITQAAMLRGQCHLASHTGGTDASVVGVLAPNQTTARIFVAATLDQSGLISWQGSQVALAILVGPDHRDRAAALQATVSELSPIVRTGPVDIDVLWPTGFRPRGEAVEAVLTGLI